MLASGNGHTEIVLALLAAPGIDVNHAQPVSIYPLTTSHVVVGSEGVGEVYLTLSPTLTLIMMTP